MTFICQWTLEQLICIAEEKKIQSMSSQRPVNEIRVKDIYQYILNNYDSKTFVIGTVVLSKTIDDVYNIIDGQHRINALLMTTSDDRLLLSKFGFTLSVDVRTELAPEEEIEIFRIINLAVPLGPMMEEDKNKIYEFLESWFSAEYRDRFSASKKPIIPNMNLKNLIDKMKDDDLIGELYDSGIIDELNDMILQITALNNHLSEIFLSELGYNVYQKHADSAGKKHNLVYFAALIKKIASKDKPCYLGLIPKYRWITFIGHHNRI